MPRVCTAQLARNLGPNASTTAASQCERQRKRGYTAQITEWWGGADVALCRFRSAGSRARPTGNQSFFGLSAFLTSERLSIPDRLSVLVLRSPISRFSFSDRVSMPLRLSFLPRRSLPDRFTPSPMCILLSQTNRKYGGQPNQSGRRSYPSTGLSLFLSSRNHPNNSRVRIRSRRAHIRNTQERIRNMRERSRVRSRRTNSDKAHTDSRS
jgi:hypothetical protein